MGISIHYSGRITDKRRLPQLIEEVQEIATVHSWKSQVYEREFPIESEAVTSGDSRIVESTHDGNLYGIDFTPKAANRFRFAFSVTGK